MRGVMPALTESLEPKTSIRTSCPRASWRAPEIDTGIPDSVVAMILVTSASSNSAKSPAPRIARVACTNSIGESAIHDAMSRSCTWRSRKMPPLPGMKVRSGGT